MKMHSRDNIELSVQTKVLIFQFFLFACRFLLFIYLLFSMIYILEPQKISDKPSHSLKNALPKQLKTRYPNLVAQIQGSKAIAL